MSTYFFMINTFPILITSAIKPPENFPALAMQDSDIRKAATKASIYFWVAQGAKELVIVDSTATDVLNSEDLELFKRLGVHLEHITFTQDNEKVRTLGLGYAEGNLLKYGVENSELISKKGSFFKCTGKVFCRNFADIFDLVVSKKISNLFWQRFPSSPDLVETRFFFCSLDSFHRNILPCYLNSDTKNIIEADLAKVLGSQLNRANEIRPLLTGFSGGPGNQYFGGRGYLYEEKAYGDLDSHFPCWFNTISGAPKLGVYL
ncbi:hypothetical protein G6653_09285 [Polynucleobacter paneuropaeus]|nr:hypothetical protein [Polynucleobacter paneuropaeus]MBT8566011.1 hypothetical protein [Polynucleobacter paneuropaeus]MBT8582961.1 hypothetical protein [Polynucleobacter paneuropaeus]MBT8611609.1 hypothetical protein [Polynucleobacter paneuropaeus]